MTDIVVLEGTSINCRERPEDKADGAQKPLSIRPTKYSGRATNRGALDGVKCVVSRQWEANEKIILGNTIGPWVLPDYSN